MSIRARDIRIVRKDKLHKTRGTRNLVDGGGGGCPPITLGDFVSPPTWLVGVNNEVFAPINGGDQVYVPVVTSGALPDGLTLDVFGDFIWIHGTPTTFEISTFSIGGTDANGCVITPKEYTVEVWAQFTNNTPTPIGAENETIHSVPASGLPTILGTDVSLVSVTLNITLDGLEEIVMGLNGPEDGYNIISSPGDISGNNLTNTVIDTTSVTLISSGTAPYTGVFDGMGLGSFQSNFVNQDPNYTWQVILTNQGLESGSIDSVTLIFKPI